MLKKNCITLKVTYQSFKLGSTVVAGGDVCPHLYSDYALYSIELFQTRSGALEALVCV